MNKINLIGKNFLRLTVLAEAGKQGSHLTWKCRCICGKERIVLGSNLKSGHTVSCGCIRVEHGQTGTKEHRAWRHMKERCLNKNHPNYHHYGGRGITICSPWVNFKPFFKDMGKCPPGMTLDRINNNLNYSPGNCRWATRETQSNNTRRTIFITYKNNRLSLSQWSRKAGIPLSTLCGRIKRKFPLDKLFVVWKRRTKAP